ncbi:PREDICTED: natural killer cell receptor 2B4 [Miniopterus natalensis]|uniref:natural killer cell receptor 2B4 n=1 Tax=Miniopterus natalensis TaxID=291302 RepID=UPI0007A6ECF3|nr:PREDICTED: natural killer cell receptor 2B4 [Miniopterus natalensis]
MAQDCLILTWKNESGLHDVKWNSGDQFSKRFNFTIKDLSLLIKAAQHQDSGIYSLEVTNDSGRTTTHYFNVSVTDPDGNSGMKEESGALDGGFGLLPLLMTIMVLITTLFFGTLVWFCVWRRKRKPPEPSPEEFLTVYEDVNNLPIRSNQEHKQEQNSPGKGNTVYSVILPQSSASTSRETATTLYSVVLPSRKSGSKKRSHSPSFISTIYEEVGRIQPKAQNPA